MSDGSFWSLFKARYLVKKPLASAATQAERSELRRTLGAFELTALGVGAIVGAGIFATIGAVTSGYTGPAVILSILLIAAFSAVVALAYTELATMMPLGGSAYSYTYTSLGELLAWLTVWALMAGYVIGNMAVATSFAANLQGLLEPAGLVLPPALRSIATPENPQGAFDLFGFLVCLLVTVLLLRPVKESARANTAMVVVKIAILVAFVAVAVPHIDSLNYQPFFKATLDVALPGGFTVPGALTAVVAGAGLIFFAFIGFDAVSTAAEETKNPSRDIPLGILGSLAVCALLYIAVALALTGVLPLERITSGDPLADALREIGYGPLAIVMNAGGLLASLSVLLVFQLGASRILYTLSRDGLLPGWFGVVSAKHATPNRITIAVGIFTAIGAGFLPLTFLLELTNVGTLFAFALVLASVPILRKAAPNAARPFRSPGSPWLPLLGIVTCVLLTLFFSAAAWLGFVLWMGAGLMIYAAYGARHSRMRAPALEEALSAPDPDLRPVPIAGVSNGAPEARPGALARLAQKGNQKK
ncbi:MAG TPA: amino acid permease [Candidatus Thermoplasmatota archaeon]|nr:amino acid permease [Candidatus Thermoplasmatota archaeon]